jgi:DNA-binding NtrC family response regulator
MRNDQAIGVGVKPKTTQARVLIVDDEEDLCWTLTKILQDEDLNYQVLSAHTGKAALRHLQKDQHIRLALLDVRLPDLGEAGGLVLFEKVKRLRPKMPVILMSAFGAPKVKSQATRLGAVAFLDKPFRIEKLLKILRETLG